VSQDLVFHLHVNFDDGIDESEPLFGEAHDHLAPIVGAGSLDQAALGQSIDPVGDGAGGDHRLVDKLSGAHTNATGVVAALAANASFAVGVVLTKRWRTPANRLATTGWQLILGGAVLIALTAVLEGAPPSLSIRNAAGFAYLGGVGTALAFVLWFNGIRRLPTAAPPLLGLAAPITGATLGWIVLGQTLSPLQLLGMAISIGAVIYGATLGAGGAELDTQSTTGRERRSRKNYGAGAMAAPSDYFNAAKASRAPR
jgi:probable blue pigment (indigoidine) exporter